MRIFFITLVVVLLLVIGVFSLYRLAFAPTASDLPIKTVADVAEIKVLARNLSVPWDLAKLPSGDFLITERTGDLIRLNFDGSLQRFAVPAVAPAGEGGLMGIALHPEFESNNHLFLYRTISNNGRRENEVVRFVYEDSHVLRDETIILTNIPGATYHDGGALSFGPDGYLYLTTGDAGVPTLAQDLSSIAGKVLRITTNGEAAPGNPFGNLIYSYGHRNAQGLAWDSIGQLWLTEHGRSGLQSGLDELNLITPGSNYGWPDSEGDTVLPNTVAPMLHSGARETWAPASLAYANGALYFAGLRGQRLYRAELTEGSSVAELTAFFPEEYGRLRATRIFGDTLYLTTSNTDGRGQTRGEDDVLLAIPLALLNSTEGE